MRADTYQSGSMVDAGPEPASASARGAWSKDRQGWILSVILFLLLMGGWELAVRLTNAPAFVVPTPSAIAVAVAKDLGSGLILPHILVTFAEVIAGFALAVVGGVTLGAAIALVPLLDRMLYPYIVVLQTVPKIAVAPLLIIWLGYGLASKVVIVALVAFFPILVNVAAGLKTVDPKQIMLMRSLRASGWAVLLKVRLPNTLPYLVAGLDVAIVFAVIGAIVGEFIGASQGLGSLIVQRQYSMDVAGVFSAIVFLSVLGIGLNLVLRLLSRNLAFWSRTEEVISA